LINYSHRINLKAKISEEGNAKEIRLKFWNLFPDKQEVKEIKRAIVY
jgi:hypothetical protein